jgi:hypothetical protein
VEAPGELLQGESIADLQEGGCRPLVGDQRPQGLVAAGKAPHHLVYFFPDDFLIMFWQPHHLSYEKWRYDEV